MACLIPGLGQSPPADLGQAAARVVRAQHVEGLRTTACEPGSHWRGRFWRGAMRGRLQMVPCAGVAHVDGELGTSPRSVRVFADRCTGHVCRATPPDVGAPAARDD